MIEMDFEFAGHFTSTTASIKRGAEHSERHWNVPQAGQDSPSRLEQQLRHRQTAAGVPGPVSQSSRGLRQKSEPVAESRDDRRRPLRLPSRTAGAYPSGPAAAAAQRGGSLFTVDSLQRAVGHPRLQSWCLWSW